MTAGAVLESTKSSEANGTAQGCSGPKTIKLAPTAGASAGLACFDIGIGRRLRLRRLGPRWAANADLYASRVDHESSL